MKRYFWSLLLLLALPALACAQTPAWNSLDLTEMDYPLASIDNLFIPLANPSLLGTGHASGLGWANTLEDWKFRQHYWLFANADNLSYTYEYTKDAFDVGTNFHTLALGTEALPQSVLPNLYLGTHYRWQNSDIRRGDWRTAATYRPHSSASLALSLDHAYQKSPAYHAGAAIRPLAFVPGLQDQRLELSADIDYDKDTGSYGFNDLVLGAHTRILDGLNLGASYNLDQQTAWLNFSLSIKTTDLGALATGKAASDHITVPYIHFADNLFRPFLGLKGKNWYAMKLGGEIKTYAAPKYTLGKIKIMDNNSKSIEAVIRNLEKAKSDPSVHGILLKNPSFSTSYGLLQELTAAMQDFKSEGKQIACYYDNISNAGYVFAASVADAIYLNPLGLVDLRGISVTSPYFKELLDSLGVDVQNYRSHKYKNAGNMFSETEMTEAEREVYDSLLQSIYDQMVAAMNANRGDKLAASVQETVDAGPYFLASDALAAGLVDKVIYEDELNDLLKDEFGFSGTQGRIPDYIDYSWSQPRESLIAVIYAQGNIVMGKGEPGSVIAHENTVKLIRAARKNPMYKGIILRVDSGGGSAQASDIILRELQLAQSENQKPVVVSMSGVAGSGGYYIACGADRIVADPATITGSIGVIGLSLRFPRLYDKIGVNWSTVTKGANADFGATHRASSAEEDSRMTRYIEAIYEDFVSKVDAGRDKLDYDAVHAIAQGRVWTGEQALANGLIDALGGLDTAIEEMRAITGIKGKIKLVDATTSRQGMRVDLQGSPFGASLQSKALDEFLGEYIKVYELWRDFGDESVLMLTPLELDDVQF
ncbi:MAG: signal peptide peptidase SppA [Candidatus Cloacimonetes bacterium]|nr:signal peptide peptidase SppA [Candidatus Cloacimonadota bacterium]